MIGRYASLPLLLIAAILQTTLLPQLQIRGGQADLIFMLVLSWTLLAGVEEGIVWALVGGVAGDLLSGMPLGTSALALVIVMFGIGSAAGEVGRGNLIVPPLAAALGTGIYQALLIGLYTVLGRPVPIRYSLLNVTLPTLILDVILILPIFRLVGALYEAVRPRRVTL